MFDRLPTPFGLVRAGVAPDHPKIKSVIRVYEKTAAREGFRFFGNVHVGEHVTLEDLREHYHAVICAYGTSTDRSLGIDGEELPGSHAATEFVAWYNAHPDFADRVFDLDTHRVVVIGNGNVAADVARMLALTREELEETDTADHAIDVLAESGVEEIVVLGRRGPAQAAFTNPEVRELGEMLDADIVIDLEDVALDDHSKELDRVRRGRADQQAERRDLHGLRRARARGQAQADRPALPRLARRDQGRRQGRVDRRRQERASEGRGRLRPCRRHRRARGDRDRAGPALDRLQGREPRWPALRRGARHHPERARARDRPRDRRSDARPVRRRLDQARPERRDRHEQEGRPRHRDRDPRRRLRGTRLRAAWRGDGRGLGRDGRRARARRGELSEAGRRSTRPRSAAASRTAGPRIKFVTVEEMLEAAKTESKA